MYEPSMNNFVSNEDYIKKYNSDEIFQKGKSMDMFDVFPNMTEKEAKTLSQNRAQEKKEGKIVQEPKLLLVPE